MMSRFYYINQIKNFIGDDENLILGQLAKNHGFDLEEQQKYAWLEQINLLKGGLVGVEGSIIFEYSIPRMGKRIDCVIISGAVVFAIEFKVGAEKFESHAKCQVMDYALDLKNFHELSQKVAIVPVLICTRACQNSLDIEWYEDKLANPVLTSGESLRDIIVNTCQAVQGEEIHAESWIHSRYKPTPSIIEAAQILYQGHSVEAISRSDSGAINFSKTSLIIEEVIQESKKMRHKSICFVTGVPGAGKTLVGLNLASSFQSHSKEEHAVFLSGNGPLVEVLQEALARNEVQILKEQRAIYNKNESRTKVKSFVQNIHHFRDDGLAHSNQPHERVAIFDEAQRAWTLEQTSAFMRNKKGIAGFNQSEPEFLISLMDRHEDWATVVCLIGGGQEINTGEAGIQEWLQTLERSFPDWKIYVSSNLSENEYTQGKVLFTETLKSRIHWNDDLHLSMSIRSFRTENVAIFVKAILDCEVAKAQDLFDKFQRDYPIVITRNLEKAKEWLRMKSRGSERYGIVASSGAMRLKSFGVNVKCKIDPSHWFLNDKCDVRSSYFLEDVATEFDIQGLELDWICLAWDADMRFDGTSWNLKSFKGTRWQDVKKVEYQLYLKNTYRVLMTRARQGLVIFVPHGDPSDLTRLPSFYDGTFEYFRRIGIPSLD